MPYADEAPHSHFILRRLRYSEHFGGKFGSVGAKKLLSFSFFFFHNMLGLKSVSFKLVSLFLRRVALLFMHNLTTHNLLVRIIPFSQDFRPPGS